MRSSENIEETLNKERVFSASPAELTLMLYEGALKFCTQALKAMEEKDNKEAREYINKTYRIFEHLDETLDHKYPVAKDFNNVYLYLMQQLYISGKEKDANILRELIGHMTKLRDTWAQFMEQMGYKKDISKDEEDVPVYVDMCYQFSGKEYYQADLIQKAKECWKNDLLKDPYDLKSMRLYLKTDENKLYCVFNDSVTSAVDL